MEASEGGVMEAGEVAGQPERKLRLVLEEGRGVRVRARRAVAARGLVVATLEAGGEGR